MEPVKMLRIIYLIIAFNGLIQKIDSSLFDMDSLLIFSSDVLDSKKKDDIPIVGSLILGSAKYKMDNMLKQLARMTKKLEQMNVVINAKLDKIMEALMSIMPVRDDMKAALNEFHSYIVRINGLWLFFEKYSQDTDSFNQYTIENFIDATTSLEEGDLPNILNRMHRLFVPNEEAIDKKSLFDLVLEFRKVNDPRTICDQSRGSYQYRIFQLYKILVTTEIRGFLMSVFSFGLLSAYKNATFANELKVSEARFILRTKDYLEKIKEVMSKTSDEILICGTEQHERGKTFVEFEHFSQLIASTEYELGDSYTCYYTCAEMNSGRVYRCPRNDYTGVGECINSTPCKGIILGCSWCGDGKICYAPSGSTRRYQYLDMANRFYGQRRGCEGREDWVGSFLLKFYSCDICLCTCIQDADDSPAMRTWSFRPQIADIKNNKVIVGVKFAFQENMVHIQAAQGVLGKLGTIEREGLGIIPLENFHYDSSNNKWSVERSDGDDSELQVLTEDVDYMRMLHDNKKWLNIDDIYIEKDYVITGVMLNKKLVSGDTHVALQLHVTKFNFTDGKLSTDDNDSYWVTSSNMRIKSDYYKNKRTRFRSGQDVGTNPEEITDNYPDSHPNQYIEFGSSSSWSDAGQQTVPYIDLRTVIPKPRLPLGGMGIYHKGDPASAGYLALKVMHLDLALYINPTLSEEDMAKFKQQLEDTEIPENDNQDLIDEEDNPMDF